LLPNLIFSVSTPFAEADQARQLHLITVSGEHKDEWHGDEVERQQADGQISFSFSLTHYDVYDQHEAAKEL
jgi:hypothetical protein